MWHFHHFVVVRVTKNNLCHQQDKKEKDVDGLGKRRKTSQSEDVSSSDSFSYDDLVMIVWAAYPSRTDKLIPLDRLQLANIFSCFLLSHRRRYPGPVVTTGRLSQLSCRREKWTPLLWGTTTKSRSWPTSCWPSLRRTLHNLQDSKDRYGGSHVVHVGWKKLSTKRRIRNRE